MSYNAPEWVRPMTKEKWGRLVEERETEGGGAGLVWAPNNRPLELANEFLSVVAWAQHLERELTSTNKMLGDIYTRIGDLSVKSLSDQLKQNDAILSKAPTQQ